MSVEAAIATKIIEMIRDEQLAAGAHLPAQMLANRLRVSRSPVNQALNLLCEKGLLRRERNRGFFLVTPIERPITEVSRELGIDEHDFTTSLYFQLAEDRLRGALSDEVSEAQLKIRYGVTNAQLQAVLARVTQEGWIEKKPGYGWVFSSMLTTPGSLLQSYRLRMAVEPAALLEPGFCLERHMLARCREAELHLLSGGIETDSADQLHNRGVNFHESLVEASGNAFFIDTIKRVNRVRRLLSYRSMGNRDRYREHCKQHLHILDLIERDRPDDASVAMREHLNATLVNLSKISHLLGH